MKNRIYYLIVLMVFTGCKCFYPPYGIVVDEATSKPLSGVSIYYWNEHRKTMTDIFGKFQLNSVPKVFMFFSKNINLEKDGYFGYLTKIFPGKLNIIHLEFDSINWAMSRWIYFNLKDTTEIKVIAHCVAACGCGIRATASETIGLRTVLKDTIRVLELCNTDKHFNIGQLVKVAPRTRPGFLVSLPLFYFQDKQGKIHPDSISMFVLKTTYGNISAKQ